MDPSAFLTGPAFRRVIATLSGFDIGVPPIFTSPLASAGYFNVDIFDPDYASQLTATTGREVSGNTLLRHSGLANIMFICPPCQPPALLVSWRETVPQEWRAMTWMPDSNPILARDVARSRYHNRKLSIAPKGAMAFTANPLSNRPDLSSIDIPSLAGLDLHFMSNGAIMIEADHTLSLADQAKCLSDTTTLAGLQQLLGIIQSSMPPLPA